MRLQRYMHAYVRGDVVALDGGRVAIAPAAGEVEVIGALASNVLFANMFLFEPSVNSSLDLELGREAYI